MFVIFEDPKVLIFIATLISAVVSGVVSYFVAKQTEQRKSKLEFLNKKMNMLEDRKLSINNLFSKKLIAYNENQSELFGNFVIQFKEASKLFSEVDHYISDNTREELHEKISKVNGMLGNVHMKNMMDESLENNDKLRSLINNVNWEEMNSTRVRIKKIIQHELLECVKEIERVSHT